MNKSGVAAPSPLRALLKDHFLWTLAGLLVLFASTESAQIASYPRPILVDTARSGGSTTVHAAHQ